jgi:hypothetical protein
MIKYEIKKKIKDVVGSPIIFNETIKKSELDSYLKKGWYISRKVIPVITPITEWWNKFSIGNKIGILAFVFPIIFGGIYFGLEKYLDNKYNSLNQKHENLKHEHNDLKKKHLILSDSVNKLNKIIDTILREPTYKKEYDKKKLD